MDNNTFWANLTTGLDANTFWTLVSFIFAGVSFIINVALQIRSKQLQTRIHNLETEVSSTRSDLSKANDRISRFRDYGRRMLLLEPQYLDVILIGPKNAGKSSLCELWLKPWANIERLQNTPSWEEHDVAVHEGEKYAKPDELFEVERTFVPQFRLRIRDYAGEDHLKSDALKELSRLSDAVLVLMFSCSHNRQIDQILSAEELSSAFKRDREYFSDHFLDQLARLPQISHNIKRVFAVFNKIDLLPRDWDRPRCIAEIRDGHKMSIERLNMSFSGIVEYWYISTYENTQTINLLGAIAKLLLQTKKLPSDVEERLQAARARRSEAPRPKQ